MVNDIRSAHSTEQDTETAARDLVSQLAGETPLALIFFASPDHDGRKLSSSLKHAFPAAQVIGCSTAGELTQRVSTTGTVSLLSLGASKVHRAASALAQFEPSLAGGVEQAMADLSKQLRVDLREVDADRYVGITLIEGLQMHEEAVNAALGNEAPLLSFVGGSAGDNGRFEKTRVYCNGEASDSGAALLVLEAAVPFAIGKTCSFEPQSRPVTVTRFDPSTRTLYELDERPVLETYAELLGLAPSDLDARVFMKHPLGVMIDDKPWIRSPQQVTPDGGLRLYCQLHEGTQVHVMRSTDLIGDTRRALAKIKEQLGGNLSGGLVFNCILRRLELDADQLHQPFVESFAGTETAGFHTYGESWLGHINQTLTGLWFS